MGEVLHFNLVEHQRTITVRKIETEISFKIKLIKIMKFSEFTKMSDPPQV